MFEAAAVLCVPAWEIAGFSYCSGAEAPICWRWWAVEYASVTAKVRQRAQAKMYGLG